MEIKSGVYKLKGKVLNYAWGGSSFLPELLHIANPEHKPFAEYWMGAHPLAPSELVTAEGNLSLYTLIKENPEQFLSEKPFRVLASCLIFLKCRM
jgi:mannose-6-phosphate isomerase